MKLRIVGIEFWYNSTKVLNNVEFSVDKGEFLSIIGPNGAGKTTLLKVIARLLKPRKGVIYIDGKSLWSLKPREVAQKIAYASTIVSNGFQVTVLDYILTARYPYHGNMTLWEREEDIRIAENALRRLGIEHLANRRLDQLSSGELQRVIIARVLVQEPEIILVDEPTAFLDLKHKIEVMGILRKLVEEDRKTVIAAIHDLELAARYSDKIILLHRGRIVAAGEPEEVLVEENIRKTYGVNVKVVRDRELGFIIVPIESISVSKNTSDT